MPACYVQWQGILLIPWEGWEPAALSTWQWICFWKLVVRPLPGSEHTTEALVTLTVLKSSTATERVRFCFATRHHLECKNALVAKVWTLWSCVPQTHWCGWREMSVVSGEGIVSALPPQQDKGKGSYEVVDPYLGSEHWVYYYFPFTARLSPMVSFSAPCTLNIEWNANVTFTFSKVCWKWTAMCRVFGMEGWHSEERKGYYIQRKFNSQKEKKKHRLSFSHKWYNRMTEEGYGIWICSLVKLFEKNRVLGNSKNFILAKETELHSSPGFIDEREKACGGGKSWSFLPEIF